MGRRVTIRMATVAKGTTLNYTKKEFDTYITSYFQTDLNFYTRSYNKN